VSAGNHDAGCRRRRTLRYGAPVRQQPPGWLAPVRGSTLAALVTLLTATGHVVGGGTLVGLSPLAVLVPLLATVLVATAERCRGVAATLVALGAGQFGLHYLLVVLTAHGHRAAAPFSTPTMVAAHVAATLVLAVVVAHADAAVTALVTALRRIRPRRPRVGAVDVAPPVRPVPDAAVPLVASLVLVAAHTRRGPPIGC
jgi:hypothetical protein